MPSFLSDLHPFLGTGEKNARGQTLEEFLEDYNPHKYETPGCTTDAVIISYKGELTRELKGIKVLLVKRSNHPSIGYWALPGGFVNIRENLETAAGRELWEETGVENLRMEQIATYGDYDRDPRYRVITTAYMALVEEDAVKVQAGDDAADAAWCNVNLERKTREAVEDASQCVETWSLHLTNEEKGVDTTAVVEYRSIGIIIRQEKYTVKEQGVTAVDHAAILVQALRILQDRLS